MRELFPYPKEILEHFRKPKNMGKLKNYSGVGKVGNLLCGDILWLYIKVKKDKRTGKEIISDTSFETFGCLPYDEEIVMNNGGWKKIGEISPAETVLNSRGKQTSVEKTYVREYNGEMIKITPFVSPCNSFSVTPEHPILCVKRAWVKSAKSWKKCKWLRVDEKKLLSTRPKYVKAGYLDEGDYLVFVVNRKIEDDKTFTKDVMRLIGYYLAEGYTSAKNSVVAFTFNKNEREYIEEVKSLIFRICGKEAKERIRGNVTEVYVCSRKLARFIVSIAGKLAKKKKLSEEILLLPFEKQWEIIRCLHKGDGDLHWRRSEDAPSYRITTSSYLLAIQLQEILGRGGIFASLKNMRSKPSIIDGRLVKGSAFYVIEFKLARKHKFVHRKKNYFLVPIKRLDREQFNGYVYNFHVKGKPNSYLVKGFAVHNCVVAIGISSMTTQMIKGKSLEEALKLSNVDILKKLSGQLPPIKIHCSVLAAEGVHEAIYDYYKRAKKPIPEQLQKEHERIQQTIQELERRHKEYLELERRVLEKG